MFPSTSAWNRDVSRDPVDSRSSAYIASIDSHGNHFLHADFGGGGAYGIPYGVVPRSQRRVPIHFTAYGDESDRGPYPIPANARVEQGSDRHVIIAQRGTGQPAAAQAPRSDDEPRATVHRALLR